MTAQKQFWSYVFTEKVPNECWAVSSEQAVGQYWPIMLCKSAKPLTIHYKKQWCNKWITEIDSLALSLLWPVVTMRTTEKK